MTSPNHQKAHAAESIRGRESLERFGRRRRSSCHSIKRDFTGNYKENLKWLIIMDKSLWLASTRVT